MFLYPIVTAGPRFAPSSAALATWTHWHRTCASGSEEPAQSNLPPEYHAPPLRGGLPHRKPRTTGNSPLDDTPTIAVGIPPKVPPQSGRFLNADGLQPATQAEGRAASHHHSGLLVGTWSSLVRIVSGRLGVAQQLLLILTGEGPPVPSLANKRSPRSPKHHLPMQNRLKIRSRMSSV